MVSSLLEISSVVAILLVAWEVHATNYLPTTYPNIEACVTLPLQYSCENTTALTNSCCNVVKGGLVLQTQYWDTYTGLEIYGQLLPSGTWTIHGLWSDNCDGSYDQYCDLTRQYDPDPSPSVLPDGTPVPPYTGPSVKTFIEDFGRWDLLKYMETFWINQGTSNEDFWAHEFSKHATCTSTFDVACYEPDYKEHQDVVNFYETVVKVFQLYPTYNMLAAAGIVPSNGTTYTLAQITNAYSQTGAIPYLGCSGNGVVLDERARSTEDDDRSSTVTSRPSIPPRRQAAQRRDCGTMGVHPLLSAKLPTRVMMHDVLVLCSIRMVRSSRAYLT